jgi:hypothetical protein
MVMLRTPSNNRSPSTNPATPTRMRTTPKACVYSRTGVFRSPSSLLPFEAWAHFVASAELSYSSPWRTRSVRSLPFRVRSSLRSEPFLPKSKYRSGTATIPTTKQMRKTVTRSKWHSPFAR